MKFGFVYALAIAGGMLSACHTSRDDDAALIAVATNFRTTFEKLEAEFEHSSEFELTQVSGATGSLYTQIINGAPYHAFLSADQERPKLLESQNLASGRFMYAQGELVLWSKSEINPEFSLRELLNDPENYPIATANPDLAPYGKAAHEVLDAPDIKSNNIAQNKIVQNKIVMGANAGQAFALVSSGNAKIGLVAKSDAIKSKTGYMQTIYPQLYSPILQDAVLLARGKDNHAAKAFLVYLQSPSARLLMSQDGYHLAAIK